MKNFLFKKIELWILLIVIIIGLIVIILFGFASQYYATGGRHGSSIGKIIYNVSKFPEKYIEIIAKGLEITVNPQIINFNDFSNLKKKSDSKNEYILVSSFSKKFEVSTIFIYDLKNKKKIHEWIPPVNEINKKLKDKTQYIWTKI